MPENIEAKAATSVKDERPECTKCHKRKFGYVIINTTELSMATYLVWKEDERGLCLGCFAKEQKK